MPLENTLKRKFVSTPLSNIFVLFRVNFVGVKGISLELRTFFKIALNSMKFVNVFNENFVKNQRSEILFHLATN